MSDGEEMAVCIPRLHRYAQALTGDRAATDDLVPDTLAFFQKIKVPWPNLCIRMRRGSGTRRETAFCFAQEGSVSVFCWVDGPLGYTLSGEM